MNPKRTLLVSGPRRTAYLACVLAVGYCALWNDAPGLWAQQPQAAPLNPEFELYLAKVNSGQAPALGKAGYLYGSVPLPMDLSHLQKQQVNARVAKDLAAVYDLRTLGRVTPVRNQNPHGTCWSFATYGSLESCLMPTENWNFSENNLVNLAGFDWSYGAGGNATMAMAYLARWAGPISETDDLYANPGGSPTGLTVRKHVQQVRMIPPKAGPTLNDDIKQALMDYGGIDVSYYHDDAYYNSTYRSYCCPNSYTANHDVTLVGWDDNFDRNKFTYVPAGDGAYIVKNSWGTGWGQSGYFYVSYYDAQFANKTMFVFMNAEATNNYARQYSYDPLGWIGDLGTGTTTTFWGANVFTAAASENLSAVGFYVKSVNSTYTVEVHTGIGAGAPRSGTLAATQSGTCAYPGYYTINLNTPATLTAGQLFSIVLKLNTPGNTYPQAYECAQSGYSSGATAAPGQSYYSSSGNSWTDLTSFRATANFCIKGFTAVPSVPLGISHTGNTITVTWPAGVLQEATSPQGPYSDVSGASPPSYTTTASGQQKYYKVR